jgi:hypothetical protein
MDHKKPRDDSEQSKRFMDAARKAEADETEEGADRGFKKVVTASAPSTVPPRFRKKNERDR